MISIPIDVSPSILYNIYSIYFIVNPLFSSATRLSTMSFDVLLKLLLLIFHPLLFISFLSKGVPLIQIILSILLLLYSLLLLNMAWPLLVVRECSPKYKL